MKKYPSIKTMWTRDPDNKFKTLIKGEWALPEFEYLRNNNWIWTEKIDGTNIRVIQLNQSGVPFFHGRTDKASIPTFLLKQLREMFPLRSLESVIEENVNEVCLYGEGYGAKIQKSGGNYIADGVSFILFDVKIRDYFLERENVEDIADNLGIDVVPIVGKGTLLEAIEFVRSKPMSTIGTHKMEGLVMRPEIELLTRCGHRIITKVKAKDFQ